MGNAGVLTSEVVEGSPNFIRNTRTAPVWNRCPSLPGGVGCGRGRFSGLVPSTALAIPSDACGHIIMR
jgi:hypothetical protein